MTPLFPAQRAAEEFEKALGGTATQAVADRYSDLLETVEVLRTQPEVLPRVEFVDELRVRLMIAAETELVASPNVVRLVPKRTSRTRRRLGTAAASLVIVGGTAGMAAAASGALPGDPLYPVKRGVEQAGAAVRMSDAAEGEALLRQSATRLDEVRALQAKGLGRSRAARDHRGLLPQCRRRRVRRSCSRPTRPRATRRTSPPCATSPPRRWLTSRSSRPGPPAARPTRSCSTQPTPWPTSTSRPSSCADPADRRRALAPPDALSSGAGAATVDNLLARPGPSRPRSTSLQSRLPGTPR